MSEKRNATKANEVPAIGLGDMVLYEGAELGPAVVVRINPGAVVDLQVFETSPGRCGSRLVTNVQHDANGALSTWRHREGN